MNRTAFTLIETLAAVTLSAALIAGGGSWLIGLQRRTTADHTRCDQEMAAISVALRLRNDAMYATGEQTDDSNAEPGELRMTTTGAHGTARAEVSWLFVEGDVFRSARPANGGAWVKERIARGIDSVDMLEPGSTKARVRIVAGSTSITIGIHPGSVHEP